MIKGWLTRDDYQGMYCLWAGNPTHNEMSKSWDCGGHLMYCPSEVEINPKDHMEGGPGSIKEVEIEIKGI